MDNIIDNERMMKHRLFKIMAATAVIANSIGFISNWVIFGMVVPTIICMLSVGLMVLMAVAGWNSKRWNRCMLIILFVLNGIEFPYLFYTYGCRTIPYFVLGFAGAIIYTERAKRLFLAGVMAVYDVTFIVFSYKSNPALWVLSEGNDMMSTICSLLIVMGSIYTMISLWGNFNKEQNAELVALNKELKRISELDALTKVYNRHFLTKYLERMIKKADVSFAVVLIDIDNFKHINDCYGHVSGDEVLVKLCGIIEAEIGKNNILARFGGEEFLMVFESPNKMELEVKLQNIADRFWQFGIDQYNEGFSFSGGVTYYNREDELNKLYNNVDEKLYTAKRNGKNQVIW